MASFVVWILVAVLLAWFAYYRTQSSVSCGAAQTLLRANRLEQAERDFQSLVQTQPALTCASDGLRAVTGQRCKAGTALLEQGSLDEATKAFQAVLTNVPAAQCAIDGLGFVRNQQCKRLYYLSLRRSDLAKQSAEEIVSKSPGAATFDCALSELGLLPAPSPSPAAR